jgi:hypothetical protein
MIDYVLDMAALLQTPDLFPCPVLPVHGCESWAPDPEADGRARVFRDAQIVTIDGAGHPRCPTIGSRISYPT